MIFIIYIIPFFVAIFLFLFFRKKIVWWEYLVLIISSLFFTFLIKFIMVEYSSSDIEYLGGYVNKITYYEDWDELVRVRHEKEIRTGTDSKGNPIYTTKVWYTMERKYHPEKWTYTTNESNFEKNINESLYNNIKKRFDSKLIFKDMKRNYYHKDGDAYITYYDGTIDHIYDLTFSRKYKNKIQATQSHTIFKMNQVDEKLADSLKLYDYPKIEDMSQNPIIGRIVSDDELQIFRYINGTKGKLKQFRIYILFFNHDEFEKSEFQKSYWQNGNKNEFVVTLGMKEDSVAWVNCFSWCDIPKLEIMTKNYFIENPKLDLKAYGNWLNSIIDNNWERKEFKDFNYINVELTDNQNIWLFILVILLNISISLIIIHNNFVLNFKK